MADPSPAAADPVVLPRSLLDRYPRFSLFNSPYPAHDRGCAVDLYSEDNVGRSPVAGTVRDTRTVRCPPKPYAVDRDHLVVVDVDDDWATDAGLVREPERSLTARVLHVDPAVAAGDRVEPGDPLGEMVRSGFFGRWVDNHVHLGFRLDDANPYRATGSVPLEPGVEVAGVPWDGTGTVVETGATYAMLDAPVHPEPGTWAALGCDAGVPLDGGLVHYAGGGVLADRSGDTVSLLGEHVGERVRDSPARRTVAWADVAVCVERGGATTRATGLSLFASRRPFGAKLVFHEGHALAVGDRVSVSIRPTTDPTRLG